MDRARTRAFTPDVVNMQALNNHLLIPRPYDPRMRSADVLAVLKSVLAKWPMGEALLKSLDASFLRRHGLATTVCWIKRQGRVFATFSRAELVSTMFMGIETISDVAGAFKDGFPEQKDKDVEAIVLENNARNFDSSGKLREGWWRFVIPENTIDLFEAYILLVAAALGVRVDWVDTWFYHVNFGGLHCGTNVLRTPERGQFADWWRL
jgi:hypothetical protein